MRRGKLQAPLEVVGPLGFRVWLMNERSASMVQAHAHADLELNFVTDGWLTYAYGGQVVKLEPGSLAVFWGSVPHQTIDCAPRITGVWATFTLPMLMSWKLPERMDERLLKGEFLKIQIAPEDLAHEEYVLRRWAADVKRGTDEQRTVQLELEARMRRMASEAPSSSRRTSTLPPEPGIERALAYIHQKYREPIPSSEIAGAAGWHEKYLMRAFKRTLGMTLGEYLTRLRISHAQWLLISTEKSMLDIAFESGFQSAAPFYQAFRKVSQGVTPLQFRKSAQAAAPNP
ncbi:MAG TPA: helix-turn-helix domain-containing protein [Planctomycetota bacterium]|nr:helix-turn-helix domain-containing protein [Planctomycetota bacterium]